MAKNPNLLKPPDRVAGLKTLNKSLFEKPIKVPFLKIKDLKVSTILPIVKKLLLKMDNFKPVQTVSQTETHIYLNPELVEEWCDLGPDITEALSKLSQDQTLEKCDYTLKYENFSLETILRAVLPPNVEGVSSFTKVGHIVHVNLREHLLEYKDIIGEVLFEKVPNCRSVVNKVANIDNTYRNFSMEVLRGESDMHTSVKENKCVFEFDFSKVYWNSRLCTEHERIVKMIQSGDVVFDVFAGVGPFSLPLAKKKCHVFANDLNPESYKWLNHNSTKNKIDSKFFKSYNKDGREFICEEIKAMLPQFFDKNVYILMNLPAMAVEFLSTFVGLYEDGELRDVAKPPKVVIYCFAKGENYENIAKDLVFKNIGRCVNILDVFKVRTVSSLKEMMRITFELNRDILVKNCKRKSENNKGGTKKCRYGEKQEEN